MDITVFGAALDWNIGRWTISDRFNVLSGEAPTNGLFTGANPVRLADYIADTYGTAGSGRFSSVANSPSAVSFSLSFSNSRFSAPTPDSSR